MDRKDMDTKDMDTKDLKQIIESSNNIVFFGGAGVSTESGIPDFRSADGIYNADKKHERIPPEEILHANFFHSHTKEFYQFYFSKMIYKNAKPNAAHIALAKLEQSGKLRAVITQNIDGLHQMAGSNKVIELHGSVHRNFCVNCRADFDLEYMQKFGDAMKIPICSNCGGLIKPDVVLYGESLHESDIGGAVDFITSADVLIIGGTSLAVFPAAGLISYYNGGKLVLINKSQTSYDSRADLVLHQSLGEVLEFCCSGL